MGSPLRLHGRRTVEQVSEPELQALVRGLQEMGLLGFQLLEQSLIAHAVSALLVFGLAAWHIGTWLMGQIRRG